MIDAESWSAGAEAMRHQVDRLVRDMTENVGPSTQVRLLGALLDRVRALPVPPVHEHAR